MEFSGKPSLTRTIRWLLQTLNDQFESHGKHDADPNLPDGCYHLVKALASKVREYIATEPASSDFSGEKFRVRIKLEVQKPLKNHVSIIWG